MASYEQNKTNKLWSVRFRVIEYGEEKQKRLSGFKTKKDADKAYMDYMQSYVPNHKTFNPQELTMQEVYNLYIQDAKLRLKSGTIYSHGKDYDNFIKQPFGSMKMKDITKRHVIDWQNNLSAQGYSYEYKSKLRNHLSAIYTFAVRYLDYPVHIVSQCPAFKRPAVKTEMQVWTLDDFNNFISCVDDDMYRAFFYTAYYTGARKGEILALAWEDIDLKKKTLRINKSLTRKSIGVPYEITTPKNMSSNRTIMMPDILVDILTEYSKTTPHGRFVFGNDKPIAENTLTRQYKKWCVEAGVPIIRIHDLRHSHVSLLISRGATIVLIAKRLGHSSTEQTLNTYAHMFPSEEKKLMDLL